MTMWKIWDGWGPDKRGNYHAGRIGPSDGFGLVPDAPGGSAEIVGSHDDLEKAARAVNCHDELVAALERAERCILYLCAGKPVRDADEIVEACRAALARAKEEE